MRRLLWPTSRGSRRADPSMSRQAVPAVPVMWVAALADGFANARGIVATLLNAASISPSRV